MRRGMGSEIYFWFYQLFVHSNASDRLWQDWSFKTSNALLQSWDVGNKTWTKYEVEDSCCSCTPLVGFATRKHEQLAVVRLGWGVWPLVNACSAGEWAVGWLDVRLRSVLENLIVKLLKMLKDSNIPLISFDLIQFLLLWFSECKRSVGYWDSFWAFQWIAEGKTVSDSHQNGEPRGTVVLSGSMWF